MIYCLATTRCPHYILGLSLPLRGCFPVKFHLALSSPEQLWMGPCCTSGPPHGCVHIGPVTPYITHGYDCQGLSTAVYIHGLSPLTSHMDTTVRASALLSTYMACHPLHHTWIRLSGPQHCCLHTWPVTPYITHGYDCQGLSTAVYIHGLSPLTSHMDTTVRASALLSTYMACHPLHHTWIRLSGPQHCCLHTWPVTPYITHGYDCQGLNTEVYTHGLSPLTSHIDTTVKSYVSALSLYLMFRCPVGFAGDFNSS